MGDLRPRTNCTTPCPYCGGAWIDAVPLNAPRWYRWLRSAAAWLSRRDYTRTLAPSPAPGTRAE